MSEPYGDRYVPTRIDLLDKNAKFLPAYQTAGAANVDLVANLGDHEAFVVLPQSSTEVDCGFRMQLPPGWKAEVSARSGLARKGLIVTNAPGQVDEDYRGPIIVLLRNVGRETITINHNDRVAQMWPAPVYKFQWITDETLDESARGSGGFGSTGR